MNIIKLKDVIAPDTLPWAKYFNTHLKGKYAYWVQMRYIVSFDHMKHEGYVACEEDITKLLPMDGEYPKPYGAPCLDIYDLSIQPFIDVAETDRINSIRDLRLKNTYVADADITIDELKKFRTWLATELLAMDAQEIPIGTVVSSVQKMQLFDSLETHVLQYYAGNMYDSTIKSLSDFASSKFTISDVQPSCGCHSNSDLSSLYSSQIQGCNPIDSYRKGIYYKMVQMFSSIEFWTRFSPEFMGTFKRYILNIVKVGLPLSSTEQTAYTDCTCLDRGDSKYEEMLKRLATSLEYIESGQISGHKNYIADSLRDWSMYLYEIMNW